MEEIIRKCDGLSLSAKEGSKVLLPRKLSTSEHVLTAKFFTKRNLNMGTVARTFRPLWRTRECFQLVNLGNNIMLFEFESEVDAEKVLQGEPWSYDRHLVVFQHFDGKLALKYLEFKFCTFWIQIHDLPFQFMTPVTAMLIGESIGTVIKSTDPLEMKGGTFMLVRVRVDVSQPLYRGRKIELEDGTEGWVAFQYECLPNLCFWCGLLTHDDKDSEIWLKSKGRLVVDDQQYGHWMRAPQFSMGKRQSIKVKGYEEGVTKTRSKAGPSWFHVSEVAAINPQHAEKSDIGSDTATASDEGVLRGVHSSDSRSLELVSLVNNGVLLSSSKKADFEAILEDIDKAIAEDVVKPDSIIVNAAQNPVEFPSIQTENLNKSGVSEAVGSKAHSMLLQNSNTVAVEETVGSFALGWK